MVCFQIIPSPPSAQSLLLLPLPLLVLLLCGTLGFSFSLTQTPSTSLVVHRISRSSLGRKLGRRNRVGQKEFNLLESTLGTLALASNPAAASFPFGDLAVGKTVRILVLIVVPVLAFRSTNVAYITKTIAAKCRGIECKGFGDAMKAGMGKIRQWILSSLGNDFDFGVLLVVCLDACIRRPIVHIGII